MTLNQLVSLFRVLSTSQGQLNDFECTAASESQLGPDTKFPRLLVELQPGNINNKDLVLNFAFIFSDRVQKDLGNEIEVLSDMLSIATDYRALLMDPQYGEDFAVEGSITITPFRDATDEETAGWMFEAGIRLTDLKDRCQIPG